MSNRRLHGVFVFMFFLACDKPTEESASAGSESEEGASEDDSKEDDASQTDDEDGAASSEEAGDSTTTADDATTSSTSGSGSTSTSSTSTSTSTSSTSTSTGSSTAADTTTSTTADTDGMPATGTDSTGNGMDDLDMTAEDFECIADWPQVLGFRINNLLGHLDEALAVAESPNGGTYPVGTIIQHLPNEAMVKRAPGFSPETMDWEFFVLNITSGTTVIAERGTTAIQTAMGQTCVSCHSMAPEQWDFICNTWGAQGSGNCGFDFTDGLLQMQLDADPRCP